MMKHHLLLALFSLIFCANSSAKMACVDLFPKNYMSPQIFGMSDSEAEFLRKSKVFSAAPVDSVVRQTIQLEELKLILNRAENPLRKILRKAPLNAQAAIQKSFDLRRADLLRAEQLNGVTELFSIRWSLQLARLMSIVELIDTSLGKGKVPHTAKFEGSQLETELLRHLNDIEENPFSELSQGKNIARTNRYPDVLITQRNLSISFFNAMIGSKTQMIGFKFDYESVDFFVHDFYHHQFLRAKSFADPITYTIRMRLMHLLEAIPADETRQYKALQVALFNVDHEVDQLIKVFEDLASGKLTKDKLRRFLRLSAGANPHSDQTKYLLPDESNYDGELGKVVNLKNQDDIIAFLRLGADQLTELIWQAARK